MEREDWKIQKLEEMEREDWKIQKLTMERETERPKTKTLSAVPSSGCVILKTGILCSTEQQDSLSYLLFFLSCFSSS